MALGEKEEKETLYDYCLNYVQQRIARIREEVSRAQLSANEETKSSVGDKYETSRAMAQLDVERSTLQLIEAEKLQVLLQNISSAKPIDMVIPGSLVTTTKGQFYIAISLGQVKVGEKEYFIVSADTPIGKSLMSKRAGDSFTWQKGEFKIIRVS